MLKRDSDPERSHERSERAQVKAAERAAKERERLSARERDERARAEKQFRESPVGRATTAFENGEGFFQIQLEVSEVSRSFWRSSYQGYSVAQRQQASHIDALSEIEAVGWRLEHVSPVYVMTGQISRDKFLSSGQEVGVMGKVLGIYLFRRAEQPSPDG